MAPALAYFALDAAPRAGRVADLGAGNGALGATLAILEDNLCVDLVDRARRAYTACEILAARLRLPNLRALHMDAGRRLGESPYDAVVLRAVARGHTALALARTLVRPGGVVIAYHQVDDAQYSPASGQFTALQTVETSVSGLVATAYRP